MHPVSDPQLASWRRFEMRRGRLMAAWCDSHTMVSHYAVAWPSWNFIMRFLMSRSGTVDVKITIYNGRFHVQEIVVFVELLMMQRRKTVHKSEFKYSHVTDWSIKLELTISRSRKLAYGNFSLILASSEMVEFLSEAHAVCLGA